jgi:hypothetical protein
LLQLDDWLPNGTFLWVGFNTNYDMYSSNNPEKQQYYSNLYKTVSNKLFLGSLQLMNLHVFTLPASHIMVMVLLTSVMIPSQIAATKAVSPCLVKAVNGSDRETQWFNNSSNSDVVDPNTGIHLI